METETNIQKNTVINMAIMDPDAITTNLTINREMDLGCHLEGTKYSCQSENESGE